MGATVEWRHGSTACLYNHLKRIISPSKPVLVVTALAPVLRGQPGRNAEDKDDTTRHLSGRRVRVLAFGLAFVISASRMIRLRQGYDGTGNTGTRSGEMS